MAREDEFCLDEGDEHHGDEDDRDGAEHAAPVGRVEGHGEKGDDGGDDSEGDGDGHAARALDGGVERIEPATSVVVAALADDDGVIDDDAEDEDEAHERREIDRDVEVGHQGKGAEETHDHAHADPDDGLEPQEKADADENEDETALGILPQQIDAAFDDLGPVVPVVEFDAAGEDAVGRGDVGFDPLADGDGILIAFAHDGDHDAGPSVQLHDEGIFGEAVDDLGDLAEGELAAVGPRQHGDAGVVVSGVGAAAGADRDIAGLGLDDPGGQVNGAFLNGAADCLEAEVVFPQGRFGDLDGDLFVPDPADLGVGNAGQGGKFVAGLLGEALEIALGHVSTEDHGDDGVKRVVELNDGFFRLGGKVRDGVDADFDVLHDAARVFVFVDLNGDGPAAAAGGGVDVLDSADLLDGFFDLDDDGLLGLFGRRGGIGDIDGNEARGSVLKDFERDLVHPQGPQSGRHDGHHEEVGGDAVAGKPGDHVRRTIFPRVRERQWCP